MTVIWSRTSSELCEVCVTGLVYILSIVFISPQWTCSFFKSLFYESLDIIINQNLITLYYISSSSGFITLNLNYLVSALSFVKKNLIKLSTVNRVITSFFLRNNNINSGKINNNKILNYFVTFLWPSLFIT